MNFLSSLVLKISRSLSLFYVSLEFENRDFTSRAFLFVFRIRLSLWMITRNFVCVDVF